MLVPVTHVDVFASDHGGGNPCPVVADAGHLTGEQMQTIAAHFGHESGFVQRAVDGTLRFRYFVPRHEMSMCVHATVGAVTVLAAAGELAAADDLDSSTLVIRTASGDCVVTYSDGRPIDVTVEQQPPSFGPALEFGNELAAALGLGRAALDEHRSIRVVSVSRPKLIVALHRPVDVQTAAPSFETLWALCRSVGATGAYVFAPHEPSSREPGRSDHVVARQFPVDAGYPEDPATGVAAGALAAYLADEAGSAGWLRVDIDQGDAMGRPSRLRAAAFADETGVRRSTVSGHATIVGTELLDLDTLAVPNTATGLR